MISRTKLAKLASVTITTEPEPDRIEGNASAVDPATDAAANAWIHAELDKGNEWAWCVVTVTAEYDGESASETLGACSYADGAAFRRGGYFGDLRRQALDELHARLVQRERENMERERANGPPRPPTITMSGRAAIVTRYRSHSGARPYILAESEAANGTYPYNDTLTLDENHLAAARALAVRLGWTDHHTLVGGSLPDRGYAFVLTAVPR